MNNTETIKRTPLYSAHITLGARMVPFSGWEMPVQYTGILEEHLHTRERAGLFDICHMGEFFLSGPSAASDINMLVTQRLTGLETGKCRYGFLLNDTGGIIDDLIVFKISSEEFMLVVNAGTIQKDKEWITSHISPGTAFSDRSEKIAKLDLQGPLAPDIAVKVLGDKRTAGIKRFNFIKAYWNEREILVSATGYTGEKGYEIFLPAELAEKMWNDILAHKDVKPVGLGARDSLRLEMGYSLYGHEIDEFHTPFEAGLNRFVDMDKDFIGKNAAADKRSGINRVLTGFVSETRRSPRSGFKVFAGGKEAGVVTSGVFSPCLKTGVGLCYIDKSFADEGTSIIVTDGKAEIEARIKKPPFLTSRHCEPSARVK